MMDLGDLRAFVRIAELKSISAAARALRAPKSSISRSLARLEAEVGVPLVDRSTRHLRVTDAGTLLRPHALRILLEVQDATASLSDFAGVPRGTLRVNAPVTFAIGRAPRRVVRGHWARVRWPTGHLGWPEQCFSAVLDREGGV